MTIGDVINECTISGTFTKEYLEKKGISIETIKDLGIKWYNVSSNEGNFDFTWAFANIITVVNVKELLAAVDLSFHEFIDAYASYLKSVF